MHRFEELATFFSFLDTFETCLKDEENIMNSGSSERIHDFITHKESLSLAYNQKLAAIQETDILKKLNQAEKNYMRIRLTELKNSLENNLQFLRYQEEQSFFKAEATREAVIRQQKGSFYSRRGKESFVPKPINLYERI